MNALNSKLGTSTPFLKWWLFALIIRVIASYTHSHWFHPDEWCQTLEPANLIAHGFGMHSQEIGLHMRNLTWASLLAGVLKLAHETDPFSIHLRIFGVNLLSGLLDLIVVWGWLRLFAKDEIVSKVSPRVKNWGLALLLLPWFTIYESVSPRAEHLSEISAWAALGFVALESWFMAGIAGVAIAAFRYPSGLISAGIAISVLLHARKTKQAEPVLRFLGGVFLGGILFGLADAWIYGRPWESFWMYLQYNIFTGSAARVFGEQGISEYKELLLWNWGTYRFMIPLGIGLAIASLYGLYLGLRKHQPWAICLLIYLAGHLLVSHKEGRFILPVESMIRWSAFVGACALIPQLLPRLLAKLGPIHRKPFFQNSLRFGVAIFLIAQSFVFLHHLRGDFLRDRGVFNELGSLLKLQFKPHVKSQNPPQKICGVLIPFEIVSILTPFQNPAESPNPAIGKYRFEDGQDFTTPSWKAGITWRQKSAQCSNDDAVLVEVHKPNQEIEHLGCKLVRSGAFALSLPAWYRCPALVLNRFSSARVDEIFSSSFGKIPKLPNWKITAVELEALGIRTSPPPKDSVMPIPLHGS